MKVSRFTLADFIFIVVKKYSNSGYIYLLKNSPPTENIRVQEEIKSEFYYDRKNMNL